MEPQELTLDIGLTVAGKEHPTLTLREPTIGQMEKASAKMKGEFGSELKMMIALVAAVSGKPEIVIEALPMRVFQKASEFLMGFSQPDPATGSLSASGSPSE